MSPDYNARIAAIERDRPGFVGMIDGLIEIAEHTGEIPDELRDQIIESTDWDLPMRIVKAIVQSHRDQLAKRVEGLLISDDPARDGDR